MGRNKKKSLKDSGLPKHVVWILLFAGVLGSIFLIACVYLQLWMSTWKTYTNNDFGFSFRYPANWYISADIVSKNDFDSGNFRHGDFSGFIFNIDPKSGSVVDSNGVYKPSVGDVEVSFYKQMSPDIQIGNRPVGCVYFPKVGTKYSCVIEDFKLLYMETGNYVFQLSSPNVSNNLDTSGGFLQLWNRWISSKIIDSFTFVK